MGFRNLIKWVCVCVQEFLWILRTSVLQYNTKHIHNLLFQTREMKFNSLSFVFVCFLLSSQSKNFIFNIEFEFFSNRIWFQTILGLFFVLFFLFVDNQVSRHLSMFFSFYFLSDISHTCWLPLQKRDHCFFSSPCINK